MHLALEGPLQELKGTLSLAAGMFNQVLHGDIFALNSSLEKD